jgi:UDP-N-acetylglucosamine 2-epimerase (non-hydrolysing)
MTKTHKAIFWGVTLLPKLIKLLKKLRPKYVLYHGDTLSAAVAAIAAKLAKTKGVHLEAGLRSGSIWEPFPEEISRLICDKFSSVLFAVSDLTKVTLEREKRRGEIVKVGNTIVDSVYICLALAAKRNTRKISDRYIVVNIHRHENIKSKERLNKIVKIINLVPETTRIIWPIHDNTKKQLIKFDLWNKLRRKNIEFSPLKTYVEFIQLLANCKYIITDGGSIQEESLVLKKPCILLRKKTERLEGLDTNLNFLINLDFDVARLTIAKVEGILPTESFANPYGKHGVSEKIVDVLTQ